MDECPARLRGRPHDFDPYKEVCRACGLTRQAAHTEWSLHDPAGPGYHDVRETGPICDGGGLKDDTAAFQEAIDHLWGENLMKTAKWLQEHLAKERRTSEG